MIKASAFVRLQTPPMPIAIPLRHMLLKPLLIRNPLRTIALDEFKGSLSQLDRKQFGKPRSLAQGVADQRPGLPRTSSGTLFLSQARSNQATSPNRRQGQADRLTTGSALMVKFLMRTCIGSFARGFQFLAQDRSRRLNRQGCSSET